MLLKLADNISECVSRAADARERAEAATDPGIKADFLSMERHWLRLLESYRFIEQVDGFLGDIRNARVEVELPGVIDRGSLTASLGGLVHAAVANTNGEARAAFYLCNGAGLHHIIGMPEDYARHVDGFVIGPQSLACGLAAAKREPILTRDVVEEPLWQPWLWLAQQFDYRACWSFPVETPDSKVVGTFAMYYRTPREASPREIDLAATITRAAAIMISPQLAAQ